MAKLFSTKMCEISGDRNANSFKKTKKLRDRISCSDFVVFVKKNKNNNHVGLVKTNFIIMVYKKKFSLVTRERELDWVLLATNSAVHYCH